VVRKQRRNGLELRLAEVARQFRDRGSVPREHRAAERWPGRDETPCLSRERSGWPRDRMALLLTGDRSSAVMRRWPNERSDELHGISSPPSRSRSDADTTARTARPPEPTAPA
jgi:hypothetical protein